MSLLKKKHEMQVGNLSEYAQSKVVQDFSFSTYSYCAIRNSKPSDPKSLHDTFFICEKKLKTQTKTCKLGISKLHSLLPMLDYNLHVFGSAAWDFRRLKIK